MVCALIEQLISIFKVIPTFVQWLPVWEDTEESPYTYDYFADLIERFIS